MIFGPFRHTWSSDGPGNVEAMLRPGPWQVAPTVSGRLVICPAEQAVTLSKQRVLSAWVDTQNPDGTRADLVERVHTSRELLKKNHLRRGLSVYTDDPTFDDRALALLEAGDCAWLQAYRQKDEPLVRYVERVDAEIRRVWENARRPVLIGVVLGVAGVTGRPYTPEQAQEHLDALEGWENGGFRLTGGALYWSVGRDVEQDRAIAVSLRLFTDQFASEPVEADRWRPRQDAWFAA